MKPLRCIAVMVLATRSALSLLCPCMTSLGVAADRGGTLPSDESAHAEAARPGGDRVGLLGSANGATRAADRRREGDPPLQPEPAPRRGRVEGGRCVGRRPPPPDDAGGGGPDRPG